MASEDTSIFSTPPPALVGKVTHFSVELFWDDALKQAHSESVKGQGTVRVTVQEQDNDQSTWGNVYTGMGKRCEIKGLEEKTEYNFRMRFQQGENGSEWSPTTVVSTIREPLNGQNLHKPILQENLADLEAVLDSGEVHVDVPDSLGFTGLMQAAKRSFIEGMELMLQHGADVDYKNESGKTALMMVCAAGKLDPVQVLRKYKASYDLFDNGGCAPVHWAVDGNNVKLIDWMAEDGANMNLKDKGQGHWTPLIRCANLHGNRDVALALMLAGADIHAADINGSTALHHAVMRKHFDLTQLLLQRLADPLARNREDNTPWLIAQSSEDRRRIAQMMEPFVEKFKRSRKSDRMERHQPPAKQNINKNAKPLVTHVTTKV